MIKQNIKLTVDAVVFGYENSQLKLLLIQRKNEPFKGMWALPGGFVLDDEDIPAAVARELHEETGVSINYLEQLYTFGQPDRDPRFRTVSVCYYGLLNPNNYQIAADTDAENVAWFDVKKMPKTAFDHKEMIQYALERLRNKLKYEPVGFELLDKKFVLSDLEKLYTTILDKEIDRRNFRKKILSYEILKETGDSVSEGKGRPAMLYSFDKAKYNKLKKQGILFEIQ